MVWSLYDNKFLKKRKEVQKSQQRSQMTPLFVYILYFFIINVYIYLYKITIKNINLIKI
jgi:hypothetical protein